MSKYKTLSPDLLSIFLLIIIPILFFGKVLFFGKILYGFDFIRQFYPWKQFIYDHVWSHGTIPFWDPYLFSGTPFITNIQTSMFYPLGFLYYVMPPEIAYGFSTILHCILGSLFMYLFMRVLSVSSVGSFLGAFVFIFNGYFMAHLHAGHMSFIQNYIWIPLIFCCLHRFLQTIAFKYAVLTGLLLGIQILGGFPQIAFYTILGVLAFGLFKMGIFLKDGYSKDGIRAGFGLVIIVCIGFSLSAIQILPTLEFAGLSTRAGGLNYEFATVDSFPPKHFVTFLIPHLFGTNADGTFWISGSVWKFWEYCGYTGICALILIIGNARRLLTDREGIFFFLLLMLALFLALGKHNPLYKLIYLFPGFNNFRVPAQILFLYVFSIAVLAGKGLDYLKNITIPSTTYRVVFTCCLLFMVLTLWVYLHPDNFLHFLFKITKPTGLTGGENDQVSSVVTYAIFRSFVVFLGILLVLFFYMKKRISYAVGSGFLIVISIVDLGSFSLPMVQTANITSMIDRGNSIRQLKSDSNPFRAVINERCFIENAGLWYRFQDIQGYDPLILKRYMKYIHKSQHIIPDNKIVNMHYIRNFDNHLIDMLNLKYIVDCKSRTIIKRRKFLPRAYIVQRMVLKDEHEVLDYMMGDHFDPIKTVVLETENPVSVINPHHGEDFKASSSILRYENEHILIRAEANQQCYLVLSEIFYPGWRAKVDGKRVPIYRGNYMFRVIPLERGKHEVHLYFVSQPFYIGTIVSLLTLLCSLSFILWEHRRGYQK